MTTKRDSKRRQDEAKPERKAKPRINKETVKDLDPEKGGEAIKGGARGIAQGDGG